MRYLKNGDLGKTVSFVDKKDVLRKGTIETFPFNNQVDIKEESTDEMYFGVTAENIEIN